jgi:F5/8 type C domain
VSTEGYRTALAGVVALLALAGCARVIGLGSDYFVDDVAPSGASGMSGASSADAASGGTLDGGGTVDGGGTLDGGGPQAGGGGVGGTPDGPICSEHTITAKATWVASASSHSPGEPASNVIDNTTARWSTGKPQSGDEWLQIDFGQTVYIRRVNLQQGTADSNDYPRMYSLCVSDISVDLSCTALASGVGDSGVTTTIQLSKPFAGRYLLIKQLGSSLSWWSVEEIEVSCFDGDLGSTGSPG